MPHKKAWEGAFLEARGYAAARGCGCKPETRLFVIFGDNSFLSCGKLGYSLAG
jgi:hypothetical protein